MYHLGEYLSDLNDINCNGLNREFQTLCLSSCTRMVLVRALAYLHNGCLDYTPCHPYIPSMLQAVVQEHPFNTKNTSEILIISIETNPATTFYHKLCTLQAVRWPHQTILDLHKWVTTGLLLPVQYLATIWCLSQSMFVHHK